MPNDAANKIPDYMSDKPENDHHYALAGAIMNSLASRPDFAAALMSSSLNPTNGMSTYDRTVAGIGQGMSQASLMGQQALANGNPLGMPPDVMARIQADLAGKLKRKEAIDSPLLVTDAGSAGSLAGQTAALAPLGPFAP